jgi:hypothetical protein
VEANLPTGSAGAARHTRRGGKQRRRWVAAVGCAQCATPSDPWVAPSARHPCAGYSGPLSGTLEAEASRTRALPLVPVAAAMWWIQQINGADLTLLVLGGVMALGVYVLVLPIAMRRISGWS